MPPALAMLCLIAAMALTGANVPLGKAIVAQMPVTTFLVVRFALASLVLAFVAPLERGPAMRALSARQWLAVGVLGLVGSVLYTLFILEGVRRTAAADAGIIAATLPAVVAVTGVARGERPGVAGLAMIALAVAGVALIQGAGAWDGASAIGNLLVGLAVACEATFVIVSRGVSTVLRPLRLSLAVSLAGLACCVPLTIAAFDVASLARLGAGGWIAVGWYVLTSSVLCTALWYLGVGHVPAWRAGLATAALPVGALAVSSMTLGEPLGVARLTGAALVIAAIAAGALRGRSRAD